MLFGSVPHNVSSITGNSNAGINDETIQAEECRILDYVDKSEFLAANHQQRLPDKETLNTYVFKNLDGTETAYFMQDNVKYYDENGNIKEKNLALETNANGYAPKSNDISVNFPKNIVNGVSVAFDDINVSISPINETFGDAKLSTDKKAILYSSTTNDSLFLMYTPTLTGFKEDIVLSEYYGVSSFGFTVKTNGMGIYTEENGRMFVSTNETDSVRAYFGDIIANDSDGNVFFGSMSVTTVTDNQEYILTVSVDEDILLDESTVYPVVIDPSITVSSSSNPNAINDTNMFSAPFGGTIQYLILGAAGTNVTSSALMSFPGIYDDAYSVITKDSIISANLYLYCTLYDYDVYPLVYAVPFTGNFWTDNQYISSTENQGGDTNYRCSAGMGTVNAYNAMNITQIVKYWKDSYDYSRKGLMLYVPNANDYVLYASSNNSSSNKKPYLTIQYSNVNQGFHYEFDDTIPVDLKNKSSSKMMRSYSNTLYQYGENRTDTSQQFYLEKYIDGRYIIKDNNGRFLTASGTTSLSFVAPAPAGPGVYDNQTWYIYKTDDGYYQIISYTNQSYCLAASSSAIGKLVFSTNRASNLTKWSIGFRENVLRVFVHAHDIGHSNATVQLFIARDENGAFDTKTTNAGGYAFFDELDATEIYYGITAYKDGYERKSYQPNEDDIGVEFAGGGNGSGSLDASIEISSYENYPTLHYPIDEVCLLPLLSKNQQYGWRKHNGALDFHKGIDISRKRIIYDDGTEGFERFGSVSVNYRPNVVSIWSGKILNVVESTTAGKYVIAAYDITGDGNPDIQVRYMHLASIEDGIENNADITQGQIIGKPGETGMGTNDGSNVHLHIDISAFVNEYGVTPAPENTIDPNVFFKKE